MIRENITVTIGDDSFSGELTAPSVVMTSKPQEEVLDLAKTPNFVLKVEDTNGSLNVTDVVEIAFNAGDKSYTANAKVYNKIGKYVALQYMDGLTVEENIPEQNLATVELMGTLKSISEGAVWEDAAVIDPSADYKYAAYTTPTPWSHDPIVFYYNDIPIIGGDSVFNCGFLSNLKNVVSETVKSEQSEPYSFLNKIIQFTNNKFENRISYGFDAMNYGDFCGDYYSNENVAEQYSTTASLVINSDFKAAVNESDNNVNGSCLAYYDYRNDGLTFEEFKSSWPAEIQPYIIDNSNGELSQFAGALLKCDVVDLWMDTSCDLFNFNVTIGVAQ